MIKELAWNIFKNTGNVDTFLELKQIEEIQKNQPSFKKVNINGNNKDERNNNCRK